MRKIEGSAHYMHHANPSEIGVNTFTLSDEDVIVDLAIAGSDLNLEVWVVDSNGLIYVVPDATIVRMEAHGVAVSQILGNALTHTGNALRTDA